MTKHPLDVLSFVAGAGFTGFAVLVLAGAFDRPGPDVRWFVAGLLVLVGVVLLASSVNRDGDKAPDA